MAKTTGMAKGVKRGRPTRWGEVAGVLLILAAALLTLSMVSYNCYDPSFNTVSGKTPTNFVGMVGANLSEALFMTLGYAAYILPLLLLSYAYFPFSGRKLNFSLVQLGGFGLFLVSSASVIRIIINPMGAVKTLDAVRSGGIIGGILGDLLYGLLAGIGAITVLSALMIISLILTFDLSFPQVGRWLWNSLKKLSEGTGDFLDQRAKKAAKEKLEKERSEGPVILEGESQVTANDEPDPQFEPIIQVQTEPKKEPEKEPEKVEKTSAGKKPKPAADKPSQVKVRAPAESPEPSATIEVKGYVGDYNYPSIDLLTDHTIANIPVDRVHLLEQSKILEEKLASFKIQGKVKEVHPGPVITMYEFEPGSGVKVSQVANRDDDLAMALRAESIRIVAPIPGKGAVGIEVPNADRQMVSLKELIASEKFQAFKGKLPVVLGKDIAGRVVVSDLSAMPHLLVAGTTGSGKSVFMNSIICSLLYRCSPQYLRMLMVDPKMLELSDYADIPHLLYPVVTNPRKAAVILKWGVSEMEERYRKMAEMGVRNIDNYNKKVERINEGKAKRPLAMEESAAGGAEPAPLEKLPFIVIFIDELSDLMIVAAKEVEESITRLAQMARAAGIHLLMATQRPSVDVITGVIKANMPARISFKVSSKIDSRTILDGPGADNLLGKGDMLFASPTASRIDRIHGAFVTESEIQDVVEQIKTSGGPQYDENIVRAGEHSEDPGAFGAGPSLNGDDSEEAMIEQAWEIIRQERKASISYIQRRMKIGYNKAARIIEALEAKGYISPSDGTSRPREIIGPGAGEDGE